MRKSAKLNCIFTGLCSLKMDMKETSWIACFWVPLSMKPNLRKGLGSSKIPLNCSHSLMWFSLSYTVLCYINICKAVWFSPMLSSQMYIHYNSMKIKQPRFWKV